MVLLYIYELYICENNIYAYLLVRGPKSKYTWVEKKDIFVRSTRKWSLKYLKVVLQNHRSVNGISNCAKKHECLWNKEFMHTVKIFWSKRKISLIIRNEIVWNSNLLKDKHNFQSQYDIIFSKSLSLGLYALKDKLYTLTKLFLNSTVIFTRCLLNSLVYK